LAILPSDTLSKSIAAPPSGTAPPWSFVLSAPAAAISSKTKDVSSCVFKVHEPDAVCPVSNRQTAFSTNRAAHIVDHKGLVPGDGSLQERRLLAPTGKGSNAGICGIPIPYPSSRSTWKPAVTSSFTGRIALKNELVRGSDRYVCDDSSRSTATGIGTDCNRKGLLWDGRRGFQGFFSTATGIGTGNRERSLWEKDRVFSGPLSTATGIGADCNRKGLWDKNRAFCTTFSAATGIGTDSKREVDRLLTGIRCSKDIHARTIAAVCRSGRSVPIAIAACRAHRRGRCSHATSHEQKRIAEGWQQVDHYPRQGSNSPSSSKGQRHCSSRSPNLARNGTPCTERSGERRAKPPGASQAGEHRPTSPGSKAKPSRTSIAAHPVVDFRTSPVRHGEDYCQEHFANFRAGNYHQNIRREDSVTHKGIYSVCQPGPLLQFHPSAASIPHVQTVGSSTIPISTDAVFFAEADRDSAIRRRFPYSTKHPSRLFNVDGSTRCSGRYSSPFLKAQGCVEFVDIPREWTVQSRLSSTHDGRFAVADTLGQLLPTAAWCHKVDDSPPDYSLPLHIKQLPVVLSYSAIEDLFRRFAPHNVAIFIEAKRPLVDESFYATLLDVPRKRRLACPPALLSDEDITLRCRHHRIKEIPKAKVRCTIRAFSTNERTKGRRRAIDWPKLHNTMYQDCVSFHLPPPREVARNTTKGAFAVVLDFTAFYQAFPVTEAISTLLAFRTVDNKYYACTVAPTGQRQMPALAQIVTATLQNIAIQQLAAKDVVVGDAYIDNTRFIGDDKGLLMAIAEKFLHLCFHCGITINDVYTKNDIKIQTQYEYLGMAMDHRPATPTVRLAAKSIDKLTQWQTRVIQSDVFSHEELQSVTSLLMWCSTVLRIPLASYYYLLKYVRMSARNCFYHERAIDTPHQLWSLAINQLRTWLQLCLANSPVVHNATPHPDTHLFTDASDNGWGAFLVRSNGTTTGYGALWTDQEKEDHINELELLALLRGIAFFEEELNNCSVHFYVDNTTCLHASLRGYSPSFHINKRVSELIEKLRNANILCVISYIRSEHNPADAYSRDPELETSGPLSAQLRRLLGLFGKAVPENGEENEFCDPQFSSPSVKSYFPPTQQQTKWI
jgi:hypothetical protein